jgi:hypothetical protein
MSNTPRLWIQVTYESDETRGVQEGELVASALATLASSGVGALIKSMADRLIADNEFTLSDTLAFEPAFRAAQPGALGEFLIRAITINVGPKRIELDRTGNLSGDAAKAEKDPESPVVVRVEFEPSKDGTALAGKVTKWVYSKCLDDRTAFRDDKRKVTIEIKVTDASGISLLATAMQVTATKDSLATATPAEGGRLPWVRKPSAAAPPGAAAGPFGPVNVQVRITEAAGPSWFGRLLGNTLASQKAAVETYVKDAVTQALDPSAASQAQLHTVEAAQTAWTNYATAHQKAKTAREAFEKDKSPATQQPLELALAVVAGHLSLAREAFLRAGVPFRPLADIAAP